MPFNKEQNRCIYITALIVSLVLIVGSIYLHIRQKTHLGRMSFNLDRDCVKPTNGVDLKTTSWTDENTYELKSLQDVVINSANDPDDHFSTSPNQDDTQFTNYPQFNGDNDIDNDPEYYVLSTQVEQGVSPICLMCLCMTVNECRPTYCGSAEPCGIYRISKLYWIDGGKPTVSQNTRKNEEQDYRRCVNDEYCSNRVIHQYSIRYKRDCNKDGSIDCEDHITLHLLGPTGCLTQNLSFAHANRMKKCFRENPSIYDSSYEDE